MALPKLLNPEFNTTIPSTGKDIKFRPFLVKEEKVLYMAMESGDLIDIKNATLGVLDACILTPDIDTKKFQSYDIEYLFLQLRARSVNEVMEVSLHHSKDYVRPDNGEKCPAVTKVKINVEDIKIKRDPNHKDKIQLTDKIGIQLQPPKFEDVISITGKDGKEPSLDETIKMIGDCVVCVYDNDKVYEDYTQQEIKEFLESLTQEQFKLIQQYFSTLPKLSYTVTWKCPDCGGEDTVVLEGLQSFFT